MDTTVIDDPSVVDSTMKMPSFDEMVVLMEKYKGQFTSLNGRRRYLITHPDNLDWIDSLLYTIASCKDIPSMGMR